jgi:hypothetical protein
VFLITSSWWSPQTWTDFNNTTCNIFTDAMLNRILNQCLEHHRHLLIQRLHQYQNSLSTFFSKRIC